MNAPARSRTGVIGLLVLVVALGLVIVRYVGDAPSTPPRLPALLEAPTMTPVTTETPTTEPTASATMPRATATAAARQTSTAAAIAGATATAEAAERESPWMYDDTTDPMGRGVTHTAWVTSTNTLEFDFPYAGSQSATLTLRKSPKYGTDVYVHIERGQFLCGYDSCSVEVRFGSGRVQRFGAAEPSDHSTTTLFIESAPAFIAAVSRVDTVSIEPSVPMTVRHSLS